MVPDVARFLSCGHKNLASACRGFEIFDLLIIQIFNCQNGGFSGGCMWVIDGSIILEKRFGHARFNTSVIKELQ